MHKPRKMLSFSTAYWMVAVAFLTSMMLVTAPSPIYELWQIRDAFSTTGSTVAFCMNAGGVLLSLFFAANISNQWGRRRTLIISLAILIVACIVFLFDPDFPGILLGRLLTGIGVGTVTATVAKYLTELRLTSNPQADPHRGGLIVACVTMIGGALGPLLTSLVTFYTTSFSASSSFIVAAPFIVLIALLVLVIISLLFVPETVPSELRHTPYSPQRLSVPGNARSAFFAAVVGAFSSFAILGFFGALTPALVGEVIVIGKIHESELGGIVAFSIFFTAAVSQIIFSKTRYRTQVVVGGFLTCLGLVCLGFSTIVPNLLGLITGGVLAGAGAGLIFAVSIASAASLVSAEKRGETLATIYFAAYLGMPIPVIGTGIGLASLGPLITVPIFGTLIFVLVIWSCFQTFRSANSTPSPDAPQNGR